MARRPSRPDALFIYQREEGVRARKPTATRVSRRLFCDSRVHFVDGVVGATISWNFIFNRALFAVRLVIRQ